MVWSPQLAFGAVLAHQGGWDEIALVAVPVILIAVLLVIADRRSRAMAAKQGSDATPLEDAPVEGAPDSGEHATSAPPTDSDS